MDHKQETKDLAQMTKDQVDKMVKEMTKALNDSFTFPFNSEVLLLPTGYPVDESQLNRIYSSILDKYIDAQTGEVINE